MARAWGVGISVTEPRRHHRVPEFYLRRFADAAGQIRVVARDGSKAFTTSTEKAAAERDFYTVETTTGEQSQNVDKTESPGAMAPRRCGCTRWSCLPTPAGARYTPATLGLCPPGTRRVREVPGKHALRRLRSQDSPRRHEAGADLDRPQRMVTQRPRNPLKYLTSFRTVEVGLVLLAQLRDGLGPYLSRGSALP